MTTYEEERLAQEKRTRKMIFWAIMLVVILILFIALKPFTVVDAGEKGVVLRLGAVNRVLDEGFHYKTPLLERVVPVSIRQFKVEKDESAASDDLQIVTTKIAVNCQLEPEMADYVYREFKSLDVLIRDKVHPAISDELKAATAKFTAEQLITKREDVKNAVFDLLKVRLAKDGLRVTEVSLTDFDFSNEFNAAIEAKVTAAELALKAENDLERVKFEQQQEIEKYKAQAEQTRLQNEALRESNKYLELKRLEVDLVLAEKWDGKLPVNMYSDMMPLLNLPAPK